MPLPASIIFLTASGASSGGSATPFPIATALVTASAPAPAVFLPWAAEEASVVGLTSGADRPGSAATSPAAEGAPATGATDFARDASGSGGNVIFASGVAVATIGEDAGAAAIGAGAVSSPAALSARYPPPSVARPAVVAARAIRSIRLGCRRSRLREVKKPTDHHIGGFHQRLKPQ